MAEQPLNNSTEDDQSAPGSRIEVGKIEAGGNVGGSLIVGHNNVVNISPERQVFRSLHQLPQPPADFTGREELIAQLIADFENGKGATITGKPSHTGQPIHGLTGMGGIGKTALGLVVAHEVAKDYPDAQIFLDLKGTTAPLSAMDLMRHVILSLEPTTDVRTVDEVDMSAMYRSVLHGKHALLFLDNARSAEQVAPLRPPETCALLVTSRWTFGVPGLKSRHVGVMSEENAEKFLLELCPRIGDAEQAAGELAKACAYLPLALRIAGSFLQVNSDWSVRKYLAGLNDRKHRLATLVQSRTDAELTAEPDLLATFELSYHQLSEENRKRWRILGVFPASFDASAAFAMWNLDPEGDATGRLLGLLLRYSLLDYDETSSRYSLHDLLGDYALSQMEAQEEWEARIKHASHYKDVLDVADSLYQEGGEKVLTGLRLFDLEWENIQTGQVWISKNLDDRNCVELCDEYPVMGYMILPLRLHPRERIAWLGKGLEAARKLGNKQYEGYHLGNLGLAYADLGNAHKAIEFYEEALIIDREIGNRRGEGADLGNLGIAYKNLGDAHKAIEFYERQLVIAREIGDRLGEGNALGNLGNAYAALGEARKAIEFYEQHLAIAHEIGDRRGEGNALGNLGNAYAALGEARKAIEFHEQRLVIAREIGDRRGEGAALGNLGNAYYGLEEAHKAIEFYEGHLVIAREIGDRLGEGNALGNLGTAYADLGETRKAIEFYEQDLAIAHEIGDRPGEGNALGNLGSAYADLGDAHKAIEFYEQALIIDRKIGDRRGEGQDLGNLGLAYADLGETRKAIEFYEQDLAIAREIGDRRGEGAALGNLGNAYADLGEAHKAIEFYEGALMIDREIGDRGGEGAALGSLGNAYYSLGEAHKAIEFYEQRLIIARETGDRRGEGNAFFNMGLARYDLEEKDRAIDLVKQALEIYEAIESPYAKEAQDQLKEWGAL